MTEVYAKVTLAASNGLAADAAVNDLAFDAADLLPATLNGIASSIVSFYNTANTLLTIAQYLGDQLSRAVNACRVDFYDVSLHLDGSPAGSPVHTVLWTLGAGSNMADYPSEVAYRVTFYANGWETVPETAPNPVPPPATIRPRARFRGGIYLGPLSTVGATQALPANEPIPTPAFQNDIDTAAFRFMDERPDFCVWSRADEEFRLVAGGTGKWEVDDAFDTIRKRGHSPTGRVQVWP